MKLCDWLFIHRFLFGPDVFQSCSFVFLNSKHHSVVPVQACDICMRLLPWETNLTPLIDESRSLIKEIGLFTYSSDRGATLNMKIDRRLLASAFLINFQWLRKWKVDTLRPLSAGLFTMMYNCHGHQSNLSRLSIITLFFFTAFAFG